MSFLLQNTYTNAEKLLTAAEELAQTGECNADEIYSVAHELEGHVTSFAARVDQRRRRLDLAVRFYTQEKEVSGGWTLISIGTAHNYIGRSACHSWHRGEKITSFLSQEERPPNVRSVINNRTKHKLTSLLRLTNLQMTTLTNSSHARVCYIYCRRILEASRNVPTIGHTCPQLVHTFQKVPGGGTRLSEGSPINHFSGSPNTPVAAVEGEKRQPSSTLVTQCVRSQ